MNVQKRLIKPYILLWIKLDVLILFFIFVQNRKIAKTIETVELRNLLFHIK